MTRPTSLSKVLMWPKSSPVLLSVNSHIYIHIFHMDFVVHFSAPMWMPQKLTNEKSILVQPMVWCRQTIIHYLNWTRSMLPHGVICHNGLMWSQKNKINTVNSHMHIHISHIGFLVHILAPMWMPQNLTNKKSTLVQLMVQCRQTTIHYHLNWTDLCCHMVSEATMSSCGHKKRNQYNTHKQWFYIFNITHWKWHIEILHISISFN